MSRICVVTADARAYFILATKLREAGFSFLSAFPGTDEEGCSLVLTTRREAGLFHGNVMTMEELDGDTDVLRGQLLSRLAPKREAMTIGIDPGSRIGLAGFYGEARLTLRTLDSKAELCARVKRLVDKIPASKTVIKVGNGSPALGDWLVRQLSAQNPRAVVELVDESGTSARGPRMKGLQKDQGAAARIAFRKGRLAVRPDGQPRTRLPRAGSSPNQNRP